MSPEGAAKIYDGYPFASKFINRVGFTHDFQNSWRYDWETGFFRPFQSQIAAEAFELYWNADCWGIYWSFFERWVTCV